MESTTPQDHKSVSTHHLKYSKTSTELLPGTQCKEHCYESTCPSKSTQNFFGTDYNEVLVVARKTEILFRNEPPPSNTSLHQANDVRKKNNAVLETEQMKYLKDKLKLK